MTGLLGTAGGYGCLGAGGDRPGTDASKGVATDRAGGGDTTTATFDATHEDQRGEEQERVADDASRDAAAPEDGEAASLDAGTERTETTPACSDQQTPWRLAGAARSGGFTGTDTQRYALYDVACLTAQDCVGPCVSAGGTTNSCTSGSVCSGGADGGMTCLPPPYWLYVDGARSESGTIADAAQLILVPSPYEDALILTSYGVVIPDDATITGIQVKVRRGTFEGNAADDVVQVLQNGAPVGTNHAQAGAWPALVPQSNDLTTIPFYIYGGDNDTWGVSWTPADFRSNGFAISIVAKYTGPSNANERAYIDSVRVAVSYRQPCGG
jgi:hypothetical protein